MTATTAFPLEIPATGSIGRVIPFQYTASAVEVVNASPATIYIALEDKQPESLVLNQFDAYVPAWSTQMISTDTNVVTLWTVAPSARVVTLGNAILHAYSDAQAGGFWQLPVAGQQRPFYPSMPAAVFYSSNSFSVPANSTYIYGSVNVMPVNATMVEAWNYDTASSLGLVISGSDTASDPAPTSGYIDENSETITLGPQSYYMTEISLNPGYELFLQNATAAAISAALKVTGY